MKFQAGDHQVKGAKKASKKAIKNSRKIIGAEEASFILKRVGDALKLGAGIGSNKQFIVGSNSISTQLELGSVAIIAVCRDSNPLLHRHVVDAAMLQRVPVVFFPRCSQELATTFKLRRCNCFGIANDIRPANLLVTSDPVSEESKEEISERLKATIDDVVELMKCSTQIQ